MILTISLLFNAVFMFVIVWLIVSRTELIVTRIKAPDKQPIWSDKTFANLIYGKAKQL